MELIPKISYKILIHKLKTYGISGPALSWFKGQLQHGQHYVHFQSHYSQRRTVKCGEPQGLKLGPLLFIYYVLSL